MATSADRVGNSSTLWQDWLRNAVVMVVGIGAYAGSFRVPFVFDDIHRIVNNPDIRHLWPPGGWFAATRPLVELTLAANYAAGGLSVWGYHALNVALHVAAALLVADVGRLVLDSTDGVWSTRSRWVGWWAGLIFLLHPLQTESVTYIISRTELLMAFWYLSTVDLALRGFRASGWRRLLLYAGAVVSCVLGMASKEVMVTAPVMVAWLDGCVVSGGWRQWLRGWRRRWGLYVGLVGSWGVLAYLLASRTYAGVGAGLGITPSQYLATQWGVIVHYLRLYLCPVGLTLDYSWPIAERWLTLGVLLPMVIVLSGVVLAFWLVWRGYGVWGVWIGWTLGLLVPTSSLYPIADVIFEHRMYLPVAGLAMLTAMAATYVTMRAQTLGMRRAMVAIGVVTILLLATGTSRRNQVWQNPISLWQDTVNKQPDNARALYTMGTLLSAAGRLEEAAVALQRAVDLKADYANAYTNLGNVFTGLGRLEQAALAYGKALQLRPNSAEDHSNLANVLLRQSKVEEARHHLALALSLRPDLAEPHNNLGILLVNRGELDSAVSHFRAALQARPDFFSARRNLAAVLSRMRKTDEAVAEYRKLLQGDPRNPDLYYLLGLAFAQGGSDKQAVRSVRRGLDAAGDDIRLYNYLAWLLATSPVTEVREGEEAVQLALKASGFAGGYDPNILDTLAAAYAEAGRFKEAVETARKASELASRNGQPDLAKLIEGRLSLYKSGRPYREN